MAEKLNFKFRRKEVPKEPKTKWPELIGKDAEEAVTVIDREHPGLKIQIIPDKSFISKIQEPNCVRLFVDARQRVTVLPKTG
ncbi:subtilisin inhibitor CLSI-I-like [Actinia tenebrosa]|uniref:Subtilisin inhibitor CLSI-I-like n=1 Tax=Actinia tenebrosa TaxID=6105 RepID=A0A6P8I8T5_ACTTE|nr:subtilisin inhibitor CLSI-I-like [Actinia tenebrosa]